MTVDIDFVPLQEEDLEQVLAIEQCSFPTPWSKQAFISEIYDNSLSYYCVGKLNGRVVAYGGMWIIIDEAHITTIAVHPDYRGQKIGEKLLSHLIVQSMVQGALRMTLEVRPSNVPALNLYQRMGFKNAGRRRGYYTDTKEDAIIMWKTLEQMF
ncbi:MAG: ribosomal protein S18-alanine N-acetyltransferase [Dehalobacterium sp.]|jgi:ribosomal-protein-alanine N-acetyltransferase